MLDIIYLSVLLWVAAVLQVAHQEHGRHGAILLLSF